MLWTTSTQTWSLYPLVHRQSKNIFHGFIKRDYFCLLCLVNIKQLVFISFRGIRGGRRLLLRYWVTLYQCQCVILVLVTLSHNGRLILLPRGASCAESWLAWASLSRREEKKKLTCVHSHFKTWWLCNMSWSKTYPENWRPLPTMQQDTQAVWCDEKYVIYWNWLHLTAFVLYKPSLLLLLLLLLLFLLSQLSLWKLLT